jgi:hypothetical protein
MIEYIREFEKTKFENISGHESVAKAMLIDEKNRGRKSCHTVPVNSFDSCSWGKI